MADALAVTHGRSVVHRDIKPANLFLPNGRVDQMKLLDFGIARRVIETSPVTQDGVLVGTPHYMAPEQARGHGEVGASADIFSLGAVLFECLTGRAAFSGDHLQAILAKILLEEVPRVCEIRHDVPVLLGRLVAQMLSKQPDGRPKDGAALVADLQTVVRGTEETQRMWSSGPPPPELSEREQCLVSVILVSAAAVYVDVAGSGTLPAPGFALPLALLRSAAQAFGARFETLMDGSAIAAVTSARGAVDQVAQAARCALALRTAAADAPMALVTGRGVLSGALPLGEAIDRAASLLRSEEQAAAGAPEQRQPRPVRLDDVTAGLLGSGFEIELNPPRLVGERPAADVVRQLLGKPTPCVGRDRELETLRALYNECVNEPVARAALVTGPAGTRRSTTSSRGSGRCAASRRSRSGSCRGARARSWCARRAVAEAREHLLHAASKIGEPARQSFLTRVPENARILSLAKAWL